MDCEKFDRVMLDLFYQELDELTTAAAQRHTEHCTRCRAISSSLRATRDVGALPLVDPPEGLEQRILIAERRARTELPAKQRFGRAISVLAGYAMRPQLAMAALLLLVIGSSLLLLRGRPGQQQNLLVTERGVPESEAETVAIVPLREPRDSEREALDARGERAGTRPLTERSASPTTHAAPDPNGDPEAASRATESDRAYEEALTLYRDRKYEEAQGRFEAIAGRGGERAASAALYAAQSARARSGCPSAALLFEQVHQRFGESASGKEAAWQAAGCYRSLGDFERARLHYQALLHSPGFADRAQAALASLGDVEPAQAAERSPSAEQAGKASRDSVSASPKNPAAVSSAPSESEVPPR